MASSGVASATSQIGSSVAGSITSSVPPPVASRHSPPMYSLFWTFSTTCCSSVAMLMFSSVPVQAEGTRLSAAAGLAERAG